MGEKQSLTVEGRFEQIKRICTFISDGARRSGLDDAAVFHVELACDEACTNIIEHAYGAEGKGDIEVSWQIDDGRFTITIRDHGRSFDPEDVPRPISGVRDRDYSTSELRVGGLGLHFMRKLMDEVYFEFNSEKGNTLVMIKELPAQ
jgi:serine/threonine-protein kinase RsbW